MARRFRISVAGVIAAVVPMALASGTGDDQIAALIRQLGDTDYGRRERAAAQLDQLGAAAIDQLLMAAEMHDDLEVALRAGWLAESIPMVAPGDAAEVAALLEGYKSKPLAARVRIMHLLLRLDDDAGIAALARISRLDRDPVATRVAVALLVREWSPGDPSWPAMAARIEAAVSGSGRPAAQLLASVVAFTGAESTAVRERSLQTACEMVAVLDKSRPAAATPADQEEDGETSSAAITWDSGRTTQRIFDRCLARMLVEAGRRPEAVAILDRAIEAAVEQGGEAVVTVAGVVDTLVWAAAHGLPEVVDSLPEDPQEGPLAHQVVRYAMAICARARQQDARAERLARRAFETEGATFSDRRQTGAMLAKWGAGDWAAREFVAVVDDDEAAAPQRVATAILYSEFLHDRGRDGEAAGVLRWVVEDTKAGKNAEILDQFGRDPASTRARMHYFLALAAEARGDAAAQRAELEAATTGAAPDVDALIALYRLTRAAAPEHQAALERINAALERMATTIRDVPEDANTYNEYAWLVANTEGDVGQAIRYSKRSLRDSFDNASYLDTLAHCQAAAGDFDRAIRTQRLALRHEPHNRIIRLNLEAFERRAAAARE